MKLLNSGGNLVKEDLVLYIMERFLMGKKWRSRLLMEIQSVKKGSFSLRFVAYQVISFHLWNFVGVRFCLPHAFHLGSCARKWTEKCDTSWINCYLNWSGVFYPWFSCGPHSILAGFKSVLFIGKFVQYLGLSNMVLKLGVDGGCVQVDVLSRVHHKNLVALVGYCQEQKQILIYEYMHNGSLFDHLHGENFFSSALGLWLKHLIDLLTCPADIGTQLLDLMHK